MCCIYTGCMWSGAQGVLLNLRRSCAKSCRMVRAPQLIICVFSQIPGILHALLYSLYCTARCTRLVQPAWYNGGKSLLCKVSGYKVQDRAVHVHAEWLPMRNMLLSENRGNDLDRLIVLTGLAALLKQVAWVPLEHHNHQTSSSQGPEEKRINHGATSTQEDAQLHLTVAPRRMNPRRIKPDARPGQLSEAERNFVSTTAGLHACAQSYLSMTCTHDAETFLASASLVMQHGEDLLCMPPQPMEELSVQVLKRMAPCKFCKVQQTLWAFKMIVFVEVRRCLCSTHQDISVLWGFASLHHGLKDC